MLNVESADHNTDEEVQEKEWANDDEYDEECDPNDVSLWIRQGQIIYFGSCGAQHHHIWPSSRCRGHEKCEKGTQRIIKGIESVQPIASRIETVPFGSQVFLQVWMWTDALEEFAFKVAHSYNSEDKEKQKHDYCDVCHVRNSINKGSYGNL